MAISAQRLENLPNIRHELEWIIVGTTTREGVTDVSSQLLIKDQVVYPRQVLASPS